MTINSYDNWFDSQTAEDVADTQTEDDAQEAWEAFILEEAEREYEELCNSPAYVAWCDRQAKMSAWMYDGGEAAA
jgi:hypothetical protein